MPADKCHSVYCMQRSNAFILLAIFAYGCRWLLSFSHSARSCRNSEIRSLFLLTPKKSAWALFVVFQAFLKNKNKKRLHCFVFASDQVFHPYRLLVKSNIILLLSNQLFSTMIVECSFEVPEYRLHILVLKRNLPMLALILFYSFTTIWWKQDQRFLLWIKQIKPTSPITPNLTFLDLN